MATTILGKDDVVLVGNGPSVLGSELGPVIDSFSEVIRFNGFRIEGYEAHVGRRTTAWSRWYALPELRHADECKRIWVNMPVHERTPEKVQKAMAMLGHNQAKAEVVPSLTTAKAVHDEIFLGRNLDSKWPSSGALAIAHCLSLNKRVHLVGFDSWSAEPFHYYENHDRTNSHHVPALERAYIQRLVEAGDVIRI